MVLRSPKGWKVWIQNLVVNKFIKPLKMLRREYLRISFSNTKMMIHRGLFDRLDTY